MNAPESVNTHAEALRTLARAMARYALWPALAVLVLGTVIFGMLHGLPGALGAFVGGAIACLFSLLTLVLMRKSAAYGPHIGMAASLGGFVGKMIIGLIAMTLLKRVEVLHAKSLGITLIAVVVAVAVAEAIAFRRTKLPTIIPAGQE